MVHVARAVVLVAIVSLAAACGGGGDDVDDADEPAVGSPSGVPASTASTAVPNARDRVPVVVDTDLAADDLLALFVLLADPAVDVLAVSVAGTGEATCPRGAAVARGVLAALDRGDIPVACGRSTTLDGDRAFPDAWRAAADAAYGLPLRIVPAPADEVDAVELITRSLAGAAAPVTLLALGPLTSVAEAFAASPELVDDVADVVVMGGAIGVPGNVEVSGGTAPLAAEWNFYVDPRAAADVVASGAPLTLVGLDATNEVPVPADLAARIAANGRSDVASYATQLLEEWAPPFLWDPLAAIAAVDPALVPRHAAAIKVVREGVDAGRTTDDAGGTMIMVADPPDPEAIVDRLVRTIAGVPAGTPLVTPTTVAPVADVAVRVDDACAYEGATSLPSGPVRITVSGAAPFVVVVAHLVDGATIDDALAWLAEHPGEQPPMVDRIDIIGESGLPSPATIEPLPGTNAVVCAMPGGAGFVTAATVRVAP